MQDNKLHVITKDVKLNGSPIQEEAYVVSSEDEVTYLDLVEICLVTNGTGSCFVLGQEIPCMKGDVFIIPPSIRHGFVSANKDLSVRKLWFSIEDWFSGEITEPSSKRFCYGVFSDNPAVAYAILTDKTQNEVNTAFDSIKRETQRKAPEWREIIKSHLSILLVKISRYLGDAIKNTPTVRTSERKLVHTMMREVEERYWDDALTLENLASSLFVSKSHLSKLFKKISGQNFSDYLKAVRFENAKNLFEQTNLTTQEVMQKCGMRDLATFYHGFAQRYGTTPKKFRRESIENKNQGEKTTMSIINEISENLQKGRAKLVKELVQKAIDEGASVDEILNDGLMAGMAIIGAKFKNNEVYVPEVLVSARAMNMGIQILKPYLTESGIPSAGKVCIGTVQGDLHDIGKNLVKLMMESKGLEVIDLGTDVAPETFINTAMAENCKVICCSALLTTTMGVMEEVIKAAEQMGVRDKFKIMVGGAPVNEEFAKQIGADVYTVDAASAAIAAVELCSQL